MYSYNMTENGYCNFELCLYDLMKKNIEGIIILSEELERTTFSIYGRKDIKYISTSKFEIKDGNFRRFYKSGKATKFKKIKKAYNTKLL